MAEYYRNAWYAQLQKKVAELEEEISKAIELPEVTAEDVGKVLTVDSEGKYVVEQPTKELPTVTIADEGKVLMVDSNGDWGADEVPNGNNYSTTEQVVGTWVDGKPLYEKTFAITIGTANYYNIFNTDIADSNMYFIYGCFYMNGDTSYNFTPYDTTPEPKVPVIYAFCNKRDGVVTIDYRNGTGVVGKTCYVTLRYTKTTD